MTRLPTPGSDDGTWGSILNDFLNVEHNNDGSLKSSGSLAAKANDIAVVHLAGNETITGAKTFNTGSLLDKGNQVFNVKAYGATGNGTTDDTANIQTAANATKASGGTLYFPPGNYLVSSSINIGGGFPGGIVVAGSGWKSQITIKAASNIYAFNFGSGGAYTPGLVMRDLYINCNGTNQTTGGGGIEAFGAVRCRFERLYIDTPCGDGLFIHHNGSGGFGQHNVIYGCVFTGGRNAPGTNTGYAVRIENNDENSFTNCLFQDNGNPAATNACQVYDKAGLNYFQGCTFVGGGSGLNALLKLQGPNSQVVNCIFDGCNNTHQLRLNGHNCLVTGNRFYNIGNASPNSGSAKSGVFIDNVSGSQISGNIFQPVASGAGFADSGVQLSGSPADSLVANNVFSLRGTTGTWVRAAVYNGSSATGNAIRDNLGFNPKTVSTPAFPASTATYTNSTGYDIFAYITNGAGAMTTQINSSTGSSIAANTSGVVFIPAAGTFTPTYASGSPSWVFQGN